MGDASIDGVSKASLRLVAYRHNGVGPPMGRDVQQQLRSVACPENFVDSREMSGSLLRVEVRREDTSRDALPPQELARSAGSAAGDGAGNPAAAGGARARV